MTTNNETDGVLRPMYFSPGLLEVLKQNLQMSPHTALLMSNPVHAYLCTGEDCRQNVNASAKEPRPERGTEVETEEHYGPNTD